MDAQVGPALIDRLRTLLATSAAHPSATPLFAALLTLAGFQAPLKGALVAHPGCATLLQTPLAAAAAARAAADPTDPQNARISRAAPPAAPAPEVLAAALALHTALAQASAAFRAQVSEGSAAALVSALRHGDPRVVEAAIDTVAALLGSRDARSGLLHVRSRPSPPTAACF